MFIKDEKLILNKFPRLPCPKCEEGLLKILSETLINKHPSAIKKLPAHPSEAPEYMDENGTFTRSATYFDIEGTKYDRYITTFHLECDRESCEEIVSTCGETKIVELHIVDKDNEPHIDLSDYYFPKFFYPTIRLFNFPNETPDKVKIELHKAFSLFWSNPSACANSLRKTIERILDYTEGKSQQILHERIIKMNSSNIELKEFLMATKWIGNDGSHDEIELNHYDVIIAFRFIEKCLSEIFKQDGQSLNSIALKINKGKKPLYKLREK